MLIPVIEHIINYPVMDIDLDRYADAHARQNIVEHYNAIHQILDLILPSPTLITKILLGVYSCIPAIDINFAKFLTQRLNCPRFREDSIDAVLLRLWEEFHDISFPKLYLKQFDGNDSNVEINKIRFIDRLGWEIGNTL